MPTPAQTAEDLGYSMAFFNSDPELKALLNQAVGPPGWTPQQFVAKLQNTRWFKKNGEAARQIIALKTSDPATYKQRLQSSLSHVSSMAASAGAQLNPATARKLAEVALTMGWTDEQLKTSLIQYIKKDSQGRYHGNAASVREQVRQLSDAYGLTLTDASLGNAVRQIAVGNDTIDTVRAKFVQQAVSRYPGLRDQLLMGTTVEEIVDPYRQSMGKILEVNPAQIKIMDPSIQRALTAKSRDGKPTTSSVWEFEQGLRNDPRWLKTQNAQDSLVGETHKVLQAFGLAT